MPEISSRTIALCAASAALALTAACGGASNADSASDPDTLIMGLIPNENAASLNASYEPLRELIAEASGKEVELEVMTNYAALIEAQRAGTVHIAMYGPFSYVLAKDSGVDISPIAAELYEKGGDPSYHSYMVARADSGLSELSDLRDKTVCFVDPNSTSGRLYPLSGLMEAGLDEGDYTERFAGGHDASLLAVRDGDCDAGAVRDLLYEEVLPEQEGIDHDDYTVLWKSDPVVNSPLAILDSLDPELRESVGEAILERGNADALGVDDIAGYWGFTEADDAFYDPIRELCEITEAEACEAG
ncbi:phosphate/phosphite/phosphonate ABC transporter substrate-binding protein [Nocardiopsis sp. EMB25]|uniref:phosphate/phosphite/phosphonate ABC transporter substrate-binding protein n=1 Tax=Nocardiopsis TaxID=2013 RepID=UPI0003451185|nr:MULTISPECIES: phosphate/phosphite/phosphonate ABC transporter substrate-binding protein [Nocardiopsis]MCY9786606.1 phosphate/phosphite/phosphonate ABC transporter substrate-binding protein [Nocardiopsis sp. EMB25]